MLMGMRKVAIHLRRRGSQRSGRFNLGFNSAWLAAGHGHNLATYLVVHARLVLVLLCHKLRCLFRAAQQGQRDSVVARAATNLRRVVAIELAT